MKDREYTLTISILASNRKDTLPKTLNSIKPLLDNVSSELIVTDTGCDEELLELIRQYTNKIIKFEWCKDFSKARNVSVKAALGEWYMFIDDDEWFESVDEFITFFNSDEKDKYGYGRYIQRNYSNSEGTKWADAVAGRLFKLNKDVCFKDAIHERPINTIGPVKDFVEYVHHYGYVYKTEEERLAHHERNLSLLLQQVEKEPDVARHYAHIAQEYHAMNQNDKIIDIVEKGLANINMSNPDSRKNVPSLYAFCLSALERQKKYGEMLVKGAEYIESEYCNELSEAMLSGLCAAAACNLKRYEESLEYADKFFELKHYIEKHPDIKNDQSAAMLIYALDDGSSANVAYIGMLVASEIKNTDALLKYIEIFGEHETSIGIDIKRCVDNVFRVILGDEDFLRYVPIVDKMIGIKPIEIEVLRRVRELGEKDKRQFLKLAIIVGQTASEHGYAYCLRTISQFNKVPRATLEIWYQKAIEGIHDLINLQHEWWLIAKSYNIDIQSMINATSMDDWMHSVDVWCTNVKLKELIEKKQDLDNVLRTDSMHMRFFDMMFTEALLYRKKLEGITLLELKVELTNYANTVLDFYKIIYTEEVFSLFATVLPERCQMAMDIQKVCMELKEFNDKVKMKIVNSAQRFAPILDKFEELINLSKE